MSKSFLRFQSVIFFYTVISLAPITQASYLDYIYLDRQPSFNSFGTTGLIQLPTAETKGEGAISATFNKNSIYKYGSISVSPYSWLEASYFYYRPSDLYWTNENTKGLYLDKGFNLKVSHFLKKYDTSIAFGIDDLSGSGFFSKEYLLATRRFESFKLTFGLGWGYYSEKDSLKNPFSSIKEEMEVRPEISSNYKKGGTFSYDKWFRGDVGLIGGIEYFLPNTGIKLKLERDPLNYNNFSSKRFPGTNFDLRKKDSDINFGLSFPVSENFAIDISYIKGNTWNFSFSTSLNFSKASTVKYEKPLTVKYNQRSNIDAKESLYIDVLENLKTKGIFLQTAQLNEEEKNLSLAVSSSKYRKNSKLIETTKEVVNRVRRDDFQIDFYEISRINAGVELNKTILRSKEPNDAIEKSYLETFVRHQPGDSSEYLTYEFQPNINFPISFSSWQPDVRSHIGSPEKVYYGGIDLTFRNELQFTRRLQLNTHLNLALFDNFDEKSSFPDSKLPHVRTDIVRYLQESDLYISRMQLDYIWSPKKKVFAKFSAGILETMYAGAGAELVYSPFSNNLKLGLELYRVQKRNFDQSFKLLEYQTTTGHVSLNYYYPRLELLTSLSFGKYLAGDTGYTLDLSRKFRSGLKTGVFFSRTNVPADIFGEGSFDKGFYFQIPIDLITSFYTNENINFKLRPLTRDGGAKLNQGKNLMGLMYDTSEYEIRE